MENRRSRKVLAMLLAFTVALSMGFSLSTVSVHAASKTKVKSVKLNHKVYTIKKGKTVKLKAAITPAKAKKGAKITWKTSKKKVASVKNGKVKGLKAGKTTITASVSGKKAKATVYVGTPVKNAVFAAGSANLTAGQSQQAGASVVPANATVKTINYTSSNDGVASVNSSGIITAVAPGTAVITAKPLDEAGKAATMSVTVAAASAPADPAKPEEPKKTAVTGVSIAKDAVRDISVGESIQLTAEVTPANADNKSVSYKSSDDKVAVVTADGKVTGKGSGTATITVTTADGAKTDSVQIKVLSSMDAANTAEVKAALEGNAPDTLKISTAQDEKIEIPEGTYENTDLIVDAPKAHVENYAKFRSVEVRAVSNSSFIEHARGNAIRFMADNGRLKIAEQADASVVVSGSLNKMNLEAYGNVSNLTLETRVNISIAGETANAIPTTVRQSAAQSVVSTTVELSVSVEATVKLELGDGAENTVVTASNKDATPEITGLGTVRITYNDGTKDDYVVADNDETIIKSEKVVSVKGTVVADDNNKLDGVRVTLVPYSGSLSSSEVSKEAAGASVTADTDENGEYTIPDVTAGNYYLLAQKDGYDDVIATLSIPSSSSEVYTASELLMVRKSEEKKEGILSGKFVDSVTGSPVAEGLTVSIRSGSGTRSGDILAETITDADGRYRFDKPLPYGQYTIQVSDERGDENITYTTLFMDVAISAAEQTIKTEGLTSVVKSDQIRFVLTWGDEASGAVSDVDSHLVGPGAENDGSFHTWYGEKAYRYASDGEDETTYADLDLDDTEYEGPETTTIYKKMPGVYSFYVHNYTDRDKPSSNTLYKSNVVVRVYSGDRPLYTYNMPNQSGVLWYVCDYDSKTNKFIARNQMISYVGDGEEIGLSEEELLKKAKTKLSDSISKAEEIIAQMDAGEMKDKGLALIKAGKSALTGEDTAAINTACSDLNEWIEEVRDALSIDRVYAYADMDDPESDQITGYDWWSYYDEEKEEEYYSLTVCGLADSMPANMAIEFSNENAQSTGIKPSDRTGYDKMITVSYAGMSRTYYIDYKVDENYCFGIKNVSAGMDENDNDIIEGFWTSQRWKDNEDGEEVVDCHILEIEGIADTLPADIVITPINEKATAEVKGSDRSGYDKMVVVTCGDNSRTYYINYQVNESYLLGIRGFYAGQGEEQYDLYWDYIDNDLDYTEIILRGNQETMPEDITVEPRRDKASARIEKSDKDGYDKMAVVTYGDRSRNYYIIYEIDDNFVLGIDSADAGQTEDGRAVIQDCNTDFEWKEGDGEDEIDYYYVRIVGLTSALPANTTFTATYEKATAEILESDREDFDRMVVVTCGDKSRNYYIVYEQYQPDDSEESCYDEAGNEYTTETYTEAETC